MENDEVDTQDFALVWNDAEQNYTKKKKREDTYPWWLAKKCECGVASLGYEIGHSDWCPLSTGG